MPLHTSAVMSRYALNHPDEKPATAPAYELVLKYNPNHGADGRFSSSGGGKAAAHDAHTASFRSHRAAYEKATAAGDKAQAEHHKSRMEHHKNAALALQTGAEAGATGYTTPHIPTPEEFGAELNRRAEQRETYRKGYAGAKTMEFVPGRDGGKAKTLEFVPGRDKTETQLLSSTGVDEGKLTDYQEYQATDAPKKTRIGIQPTMRQRLQGSLAPLGRRSEGDLQREAQRHAAEDVRSRMAAQRATLPVTPGPSAGVTQVDEGKLTDYQQYQAEEAPKKTRIGIVPGRQQRLQQSLIPIENPAGPGFRFSNEQRRRHAAIMFGTKRSSSMSRGKPTKRSTFS